MESVPLLILFATLLLLATATVTLFLTLPRDVPPFEEGFMVETTLEGNTLVVRVIHGVAERNVSLVYGGNRGWVVLSEMVGDGDVYAERGEVFYTHVSSPCGELYMGGTSFPWGECS